MALTLSATDVAIALAIRNDTLRVSEEFNVRLGETFIAISDEHGLIEVALTQAEADARLADIQERAAA